VSILTAEDVKVKTATCKDGVCKLTPVEQKPKTRTVIAIKAECYSRIVGYYRPVQDWNRGKKEEFENRRTMSINDLTEAMQS